MPRKRDTKLIDAVATKVGLSRDQREILHLEITGRGLSYKEIVAEAEDVKKYNPGKGNDYR
jgi:hypothetical protein